MIPIVGDFNAKSNNYCKNNTTSRECSMIDAERVIMDHIN